MTKVVIDIRVDTVSVQLTISEGKVAITKPQLQPPQRRIVTVPANGAAGEQVPSSSTQPPHQSPAASFPNIPEVCLHRPK